MIGSHLQKFDESYGKGSIRGCFPAFGLRRWDKLQYRCNILDKWFEESTDGVMDGWLDGQMDRWVDKVKESYDNTFAAICWSNEIITVIHNLLLPWEDCLGLGSVKCDFTYLSKRIPILYYIVSWWLHHDDQWLCKYFTLLTGRTCGTIDIKTHVAWFVWKDEVSCVVLCIHSVQL